MPILSLLLAGLLGYILGAASLATFAPSLHRPQLTSTSPLMHRPIILSFSSAVAWTWLAVLAHHPHLATVEDAALATILAIFSTLYLCCITADAVFHR